MPSPICFKLLWQLERRAFSRARENTGNRMAARRAIMAITTRSSIRVNPLFEAVICLLLSICVLIVVILDSDLVFNAQTTFHAPNVLDLVTDFIRPPECLAAQCFVAR